MQSWLDVIRQPWHWSVTGLSIALTMFLLTWLGRYFGVSTTFKNICTAFGAGKLVPFFDTNLRYDYWRLVFVAGALLGGLIGSTFLASETTSSISVQTLDELSAWGLQAPSPVGFGHGLVPTDLFNFSNTKGLGLAIAGGLLIGFGTRYANGCTSGHAITGLSNLQWRSLVAVIGFFIGGLLMTHIIMPLIFKS